MSRIESLLYNELWIENDHFLFILIGTDHKGFWGFGVSVDGRSSTLQNQENNYSGYFQFNLLISEIAEK
jgi:hypothetical protein